MSQFTPNSFQVPNAFVDEVMRDIGDVAAKLYLIICRKTRGWYKEFDSISLSQFQEFSGKSRPTVTKAIAELIQVGLVIEGEVTIHGNSFKLNDECVVGWRMTFPSKESLLPENTGKKTLLVKKFNHASKESLPPLVKILYTQKTLSKDTLQNKKIYKKSKSVSEQPKVEKQKTEKKDQFDFKSTLIEKGVSEKTATEFMQVRKAKGGVNTERAFKLLEKQISNANLTLAQGIEFCLNRQKPWAAFEAQWYFNEKNRMTQVQAQGQQPVQRRRFGNSEADQSAKMRDIQGECA